MSKSHEIDCWQCGKQSTLKTRSEFDGCCWACGVEIDLEDYLARAMDESDALRAEVEALRKDAELYRRLRDLPDDQVGAPGVPCVAVPRGPFSGTYVSGEELDAAMAGTGGKA